MAKQVKVFNGSIKSGTIYVVPPGRVARVELVGLSCEFINNNIKVTAGSISMFGQPTNAPFHIPANRQADTLNTGSETQLWGVTDGTTPIYARRYAYLTAGQSIVISGASASIDYNFCVVEEY